MLDLGETVSNYFLKEGICWGERVINGLFHKKKKGFVEVNL